MCSIYCTNPKMLMRETEERLKHLHVAPAAQGEKTKEKAKPNWGLKPVLQPVLQRLQFLLAGWRTV